MSSTQNKIDLNALKFNQASIILLTLSGFIFNSPYLPAFVAAVMLAGSFDQRLAVFKQIYRNVFIPLKLIKPNIVEESSAPHNFAQLLGGVVLSAASIFLFTGYALTGWVFAWVVILLAAANLLLGFCAGCFIYYQLGKIGLPGFKIRINN